jgi:hypothetical protein
MLELTEDRTMKTSICVAVILLFTTVSGEAQRDPLSEQACPITQANDGIFYGNDALKAGVGDGTIVFEPGGPGFVDYDGALGIKFPWIRLKGGRLFVGGHRLDGDAGPARAYIYDYGDIGFQPIYLVFPTPGCWEITGAVNGTSLTFTMLIEKIGDGPSWRQNAPPRDRRVTTDWRER